MTRNYYEQIIKEKREFKNLNVDNLIASHEALSLIEFRKLINEVGI